jgi:hypothetical protein
MTERPDRYAPDEDPVIQVEDELGGDEPMKRQHGDHIRDVPEHAYDEDPDPGDPAP